MRQPLSDRARGRWSGLLPQLGVSPAFLTGKHGPCPMCGGRDRFRWDDKEGSGSFFCSRCGAGDGVKLVMEVNGLAFKAAAERIEALVGDVRAAPAKPGRSVDEKRAALNRLWASSTPVMSTDPVGRYLVARVGLQAFPDCLRTVARLYYAGDMPSWHPAMLAMVTDAAGRPVNLHRTYLSPDGGKAKVEVPRRMMDSPIPKGAAVRLFPPAATLGIAEGIETALAAASLFGIPCWAALNTSMLKAWDPPAEVQDVVVFADHDVRFGGQAAAYDLAHRLAVRDRKVRVEMPGREGADWNDILKEKSP